MKQFIDYFSLIFFVCYILVAFVWPTVRTYKQTRINPITFGNTDTAHNFIGKWFKVLIGLMPVIIVIRLTGASPYGYLLPAHYLEQEAIQWTGICLCIVSIVWIVIAQWQMGNSWRIGIDEQHPTSLIQHGLFKTSRNPIFLGMLCSLLGFFLLLPNALTLMLFGWGYLLIQIQIRLEEEFLSKTHGEKYTQYQKTVRRLI